MTPVPPGSTIGFLGGGQLGRMSAIAARQMGYKVRVLDPAEDCAAAGVSDALHVASFDDVAAATDLADVSDVVTYEIERIAPAVLRAVGATGKLRPDAHVLSTVQDREAQKLWLARRGFPLADWRVAADGPSLSEAISAIGGRVRLKSVSGGYDGRSQATVCEGDDATRAWRGLGGGRCVVERELELEAECSVLVARRRSGEAVVYPVARNWHRENVLETSLLPSGLPPAVEREAQSIGRSIAEELGVAGLLVVEFFITGDGRIFVNELAPRPHNTFHHAGAACGISQFEQYIRAICDLPLADIEPVRPVALANLLGDLWVNNSPPAFDAALAVRGVQLHLYGKRPWPKRKVGHLTARGPTPQEALERLGAARDALVRNRPRPPSLDECSAPPRE